MSYLTLDEAKDQCSIEAANTDHDARLERLIVAAEAWAANFLNAPLADYEESPASSPPALPEDLRSAVLLHVEFEFDRNPRNGELLLKRAEQLLWPYRSNLEV